MPINVSHRADTDVGREGTRCYLPRANSWGYVMCQPAAIPLAFQALLWPCHTSPLEGTEELKLTPVTISPNLSCSGHPSQV
jgi:hypothetical protein